MAQIDNGPAAISPNLGYTLNQAAKAMDISPRYLRETLIDTGEIRVARRGRARRDKGFAWALTLIPGHEIIRWIEANAEAACEHDDDQSASKQ